MTDISNALTEGPQEDVGTIVHELAEEAGKLMAEQKRTEKMMLEVSWEDRQLTKTILYQRARELEKEYKMTVPEIRRHLIQMVTVSV